jgi:hypothetical protein
MPLGLMHAKSGASQCIQTLLHKGGPQMNWLQGGRLTSQNMWSLSGTSHCGITTKKTTQRTDASLEDGWGWRTAWDKPAASTY